MTQPDSNAKAQPVRKPYAEPALRVFGSLADLTRQIGNRGALDAGNSNSQGQGAGGPRSAQ